MSEPPQQPPSTFDSDNHDAITRVQRDYEGLDFLMASTLLWAWKTLPRKEYLRILQEADNAAKQKQDDLPDGRALAVDGALADGAASSA